MTLTLHKPFVLSSAETLANVVMPAGEYEAVKAPNHFRSGVAWLVLADTDIGASYQWLLVHAREHPDVMTLCET